MVLQQMLIFFGLMLLGIEAKRQGLMSNENQKQLSSLVINIAYPALILSGVVGSGTRLQGEELAHAFFVALVVILIVVVFGKLTPYLLGYEKKYHGIINVMVVFTNVGFMGLPMIQGMYGADAVIRMTAFIIPFNILFYSYAIQTMQAAGTRKKQFQLHELCNTGMAACVAAVVIYLLDWHLPYALERIVQMTGGLTAPLAMMLIGAALPDVPWKKALTNRPLLGFVLWKMLIFPTLALWGLSHFVSSPVLLAVALCALATPSGNMLAMLAAIYNKDSFLLATEGIALTTAAAVVTMPLVAFLVGIG